jgi:DDE superfamily endonuclease
MIARWTNTASSWRHAARDGGSVGRACAAPGSGSGCGAKKTLRASERDRVDIQAERAVFCERVRQLDADDLVFIDETGITTAMTRRYARAAHGERAYGSAPGGWRRVTVLGALSSQGMVAPMSITATTTTRVFLAFLQAVLIPELRCHHPHATMLMDNLSAHKPKVVETVNGGANVGHCGGVKVGQMRQ